MTAALSKGAIDAYSATSSLAATWQQKGGVTIIDKAEVSHPDYKMVGITLVNGAFLKQHPDVQKAWWAVYDEGQQLIKQDPDAYLKWTAKQTGLTFDVAKATTSLTDQDAPVTPDSLAAAAGTQKFLKDQKLTKQDFSLADWAVQPDTKGGK